MGIQWGGMAGGANDWMIPELEQVKGVNKGWELKHGG